MLGLALPVLLVRRQQVDRVHQLVVVRCDVCGRGVLGCGAVGYRAVRFSGVLIHLVMLPQRGSGGGGGLVRPGEVGRVEGVLDLVVAHGRLGVGRRPALRRRRRSGHGGSVTTVVDVQQGAGGLVDDKATQASMGEQVARHGRQDLAEAGDLRELLAGPEQALQRDDDLGLPLSGLEPATDQLVQRVEAALGCGAGVVRVARPRQAVQRRNHLRDPLNGPVGVQRGAAITARVARDVPVGSGLRSALFRDLDVQRQAGSVHQLGQLVGRQALHLGDYQVQHSLDIGRVGQRQHRELTADRPGMQRRQCPVAHQGPHLWATGHQLSLTDEPLRLSRGQRQPKGDLVCHVALAVGPGALEQLGHCRLKRGGVVRDRTLMSSQHLGHRHVPRPPGGFVCSELRHGLSVHMFENTVKPFLPVTPQLSQPRGRCEARDVESTRPRLSPRGRLAGSRPDRRTAAASRSSSRAAS